MLQLDQIVLRIKVVGLAKSKQFNVLPNSVEVRDSVNRVLGLTA